MSIKEFWFRKQLAEDGSSRSARRICRVTIDDGSVLLDWDLNPIEFVDYLLAYDDNDRMIIEDDENDQYNYQMFIRYITDGKTKITVIDADQ